ncbi:MAG: acyltransferase family protein [Saprospiraceae bacterium]|nr:acyltransferase family protein [Saprospiraceae bacterium]
MNQQLHPITSRIDSIDMLRGLAMVLMALDHVRDYFHVQAFTGDPLDVQTTTTALYFTRWITHFCAPVFVFLSGVSIYLQSQRKNNHELSSFIMKRGLWLVFR